MTMRNRLLKIRTRLKNPKHWTQGTHARDKRGHACFVDDPDAAQFCLMGAMLKSAPLDELTDICAALNFTSCRHLVSWNDYLKRTHAEVLARIDTALEREMKSRGPEQIS